MSQEILTGNLLVDGVIYHASDINAAINNATLLGGAVSNQPTLAAADDMTLLAEDAGGQLASTSMSSVKTLIKTNLQTTGNLDAHEGFAASGILVVAISGTQNDYNPTGFDKCTMLAVTGTVTITGFIAPALSGTVHVLYNFGGGVITIQREGAGSQPLNRFTYSAGGADITLGPGQCMTYMYTAGAPARWLVLCTNRTL